MKTKKTLNIDGIDIIVGIGDAGGFIDDVSTTDAVNKLLPTNAAYLAFVQAMTDLQAAVQAMNTAFALIAKAQNQADSENYTSQYQALEAKVKALEEAGKAAHAALIEEIKTLKEANVVYHGLPADEVFIDDATGASLQLAFAALKDKEQLKSDGTVITDYRGQYAFTLTGKTWTTRQISKLGDAPASGEILEADLTPAQVEQIAAQVETARVAALTADQKASEQAAALAGLQAQAGQMMNEEMITGTAQAIALADSQAWYQTQAAAVNKKYGG